MLRNWRSCGFVLFTALFMSSCQQPLELTGEAYHLYVPGWVHEDEGDTTRYVDASGCVIEVSPTPRYRENFAAHLEVLMQQSALGGEVRITSMVSTKTAARYEFVLHEEDVKYGLAKLIDCSPDIWQMRFLCPHDVFVTQRELADTIANTFECAR